MGTRDVLIMKHLWLLIVDINGVYCFWGKNKEQIKGNMFGTYYSKTLSCIKTIQAGKDDQWMSFQIGQFSSLIGKLIAIENISLKCNDVNVCSPFILNWNGREVVSKSVELCDPHSVPGSTSKLTRCHGCTLCGWDKNKYLSPVLQENIKQFFASDVQTSYLNLKRQVLQNRSLTDGCKDCDVQTYFADPVHKNGAIECLLFADDQFQHQLKRGKDALLSFIDQIMKNDSLHTLFKHFSFPYFKRLDRYGIEMVTNEDNEDIFPPLMVNRCYDTDDSDDECSDKSGDWSFILPVDAIKKMLLFLQKLETENNVYYVSDAEKNTLTCYVHVPATVEKLRYVLEIRVLVGKISDNCLDDDEDSLTMVTTNELSESDGDPVSLAYTYTISINRDSRKMIENCKGISIRTDNKMIFFNGIY